MNRHSLFSSLLERREAVQVGFSGLLGLGLSHLMAGRARAEGGAAGFGRAKSVILIFQTGAPSHQDIWDLKPEAPLEVRGEFTPIDTNVAGIQVGPHIPRLASIADKYAIIRSMTHDLPGHEQATHFVLSGINQLPPGATHMASRSDWPCYAAGVQALRPRNDGLPAGVMLPTYLHNGYGFSGQTGGFMGSQYDPWHVKKDPNAADFKLDELTLQPGLTIGRVDDRRALLEGLDQQRRDLDTQAASQNLSRSSGQAYGLLTAAGQFREAFEMDRETPAMRDRYGRHAFGQSLLLARRLVEAGMPIVQANMGSMNNWDTHGSNFAQLKDRLLPPFDQGVSALLSDLEERGLLGETLVIAVGEFGRTPKINAGAGRDHWSGVFSAIYAGAGIRGGQVIGASDAQAAYPATRGWYPADLGATVYSALGIDPDSTVYDRIGRPNRLNAGRVIAPLYA
ncbi:MAG: DUF1501 domain-containing protein [Planctomycetota bacterium]|nr:MAG: DUF1501 domain-containing protein [Planctomycetota bacterium]